MIWLRITWAALGAPKATYETIERISLNEPIKGYVDGLRAAGATRAEIIKVTYNA